MTGSKLKDAFREIQQYHIQCEYPTDDPQTVTSARGVPFLSFNLPYQKLISRKDRRLARKHLEQLFIDRVTYHMLRLSTLSHEAIVRCMLTEMPSASQPIAEASLELAQAIMRVVSEPQVPQANDTADFTGKTLELPRVFPRVGDAPSSSPTR